MYFSVRKYVVGGENVGKIRHRQSLTQYLVVVVPQNEVSVLNFFATGFVLSRKLGTFYYDMSVLRRKVRKS